MVINSSKRCCDVAAKITYSEILLSIDFRILVYALPVFIVPVKVLLSRNTHGLGQLQTSFAD